MFDEVSSPRIARVISPLNHLDLERVSVSVPPIFDSESNLNVRASKMKSLIVHITSARRIPCRIINHLTLLEADWRSEAALVSMFKRK